MPKKYVGTHLSDDEYRRFSIKAAEKGKSRSGLLRDLATKAIKYGVRERREGDP